MDLGIGFISAVINLEIIMKRINIVLSVIVYAFGIWYFWQIGMLPDRNLSGTLKSSFMPYVLLSVLMIINTVFLFVSAVRPCIEECDFTIHGYEIKGILKIVLLIAAYVFLTKIAGFAVVTPVVVFILMRMMGSVNLKEIIITSCLVSVSIYLLFVVVFKVQLPGGILL